MNGGRGWLDGEKITLTKKVYILGFFFSFCNPDSRYWSDNHEKQKKFFLKNYSTVSSEESMDKQDSRQCEKWDTQATFPSLMACTTLVPLSDMRKSWERESNGLKKRPLSCSFSYTFTAVWDFSKLHMCRRTLAGRREFWLPLPEDWKEKDTQWVVRHMHLRGHCTTQSGAWPCLRSRLSCASSEFFSTSAALLSFLGPTPEFYSVEHGTANELARDSFDLHKYGGRVEECLRRVGFPAYLWTSLNLNLGKLLT